MPRYSAEFANFLVQMGEQVRHNYVRTKDVMHVFLPDHSGNSSREELAAHGGVDAPVADRGEIFGSGRRIIVFREEDGSDPGAQFERTVDLVRANTPNHLEVTGKLHLPRVIRQINR